MKRLAYLCFVLMAFVMLLPAATSAYAQSLKVAHLSGNIFMLRVPAQTASRYLLMPVEDKAPLVHIQIVCDNVLMKSIDVRLACDKVDYKVPLLLDEFQGKNVVLYATMPFDPATHGGRKEPICWAEMCMSNTFDTANRESYRPVFHHTPAYGWMNDPNGMFYLDGIWHLYFQYNPYGSKWGNMNWGHATSTDLIHWKDEGIAIAPDAHGTVFSGSCVVDHENTAGFGRGAVIALYTSSDVAQSQSLAYSLDGGKTFRKYAGNPVLTGDISDFRDPNMFWNDSIKAWNLILACGQEMRLFSSSNLKEWKEESRFGKGYGCHAGVWECPDLIKLPVMEKGKNVGEKWVLFCNINPGGPNGGSATQYFIGEFDGHRFVCDDAPDVVKWQDYGKDHYATVSFSNAPDGRHTMMAWMSNWQYANEVPTMQYRSANSIAREPFLYKAADGMFLGSRPSPEYDGAGLDRRIKVKGSCRVTLSNDEGESFVVVYDQKAMTLSVDRSKSGEVAFSTHFNVPITAPVHCPLTSLRFFIDRTSVEIFGNDGEVAMTNIVFPKSQYNKIVVK